ncbi:MAG TPA: glycosyltransferase family 4 protein [Thermoleophilaceae bacterium]|nr:glycosyltransferase family 4 protein [Thermoleophilaceae bacterium]
MARVLLVTQPVDGGVFRHVSDLARGLAERGHEVALAAPLAAPPSSLPAELIPVPLERSPVPAADARALAAIVAAIRRTRPHVIHAHSSKAGALARIGRLAAPGVPVIYTPHGYAFAGHFDERLRRVYRGIERVLTPLATRVLCVCEAEQRLAASLAPAGRTRVVHNGIALPDRPAVCGSAAGGSGSDSPLIVCLTLLRPGKGLETLIDAMPAVVGAHPRARLRIVGEGPDRPALRARIDRLGLDGVVELLGATEQPLDAMRAATVFAHPSWAESFPYALLEAMSLGLPIVATDVGGTREALGDRACGLLVKPRDAAELAQGLNSLLGDREHGAALGTAARTRVAHSLTIDRMIEGIIDVYREVAAA